MIHPLPPIPPADREHILAHAAKYLRDLAGKRLFITGATGFYGKWLLESLAAANDELATNIRATLLSRDPAQFAAELPHLARRSEFEWITGDSVDFTFPAGDFDFLLDFATPSAADVAAGGATVVEHCLRGSNRLLGIARASGVQRILYASSGAVYGSQPPDVERLAEDFMPDPARVSAYGQLKRRTEAMLLASGCDCVIARGFAFIGPYLPLTDKFAAGSFLRDALAGGPIRILGDGLTRRAYLYGADLVINLLGLLVKGRPGCPYNIGSDEAIELSGLARAIAVAAGRGVAVEIGSARGSSPANSYVPSIERARSELGLSPRIPLDLALRRSVDWARDAFRAPAPPSMAARIGGTPIGVGSTP